MCELNEVIEMKNRQSSILIEICLCIALFGGILLSNSVVASDTSVSQKIPIDIGPSLREKQVSDYPTLSSSKGTSPIGASYEDGTYYEIGDALDWYCVDDYNPEVPDGIFASEFTLRALGTTCEIWVQTDMSFPDSRDTPVITDEQVNSYLNVFETVIYPTDTQYFGTPDFHDGSNAEVGPLYNDPSGRNVILVSNIRDQSYYESNYPYYVVGFYWGVFEDAFDRNIVSIDSAAWDVAMKFYEGTLAHEYQHLIHDDYNPDDDTFMNEGCSMYAEPLCGYDVSWGDIEAFLATPDNSLVEWGDQGGINILADYGSALLWAIYLSDHYGGADFISYFVQNGVPGIEGINDALAHFGYTKTFDEVFLDWSIANLIHTDAIGDGLYNYNSIDLDTLDADATRIYSINKPFFEQTGTAFGETKSYLNDATDVYQVGSYGSDYIELGNIHDRFTSLFMFDGDDTADLPLWNLVDEDADGDLEWYSSASSPENDLRLTTTLDLTQFGANPQLTFDTKYIIEEAWDFGFVQISTDNGETWVSLENTFTTYVIDDGGYPTIKDNLPGLSGVSDGWISMGFDLSAYAGQEVLLALRYMTDWAYEDPGWWVDNVAIDGIIIDNADDVISFISSPPPETDFWVTLIVVVETPTGLQYNNIVTLDLNDLTESLDETLDLANLITSDEEYLQLIVSPKIGLADYTVSVTRV